MYRLERLLQPGPTLVWILHPDCGVDSGPDLGSGCGFWMDASIAARMACEWQMRWLGHEEALASPERRVFTV